jgi:cell division septum initiation protein DivIVA
MAKKANALNKPDADNVQAAVRNIEDRYDELASERGAYMLKCRRIRESMANDYARASEQGISQKLLKLIVKERELERKIEGLATDLEPDERSELEMLMDALGDFGTLPLGIAAVEKVKMTAGA